MSADEWNEIAGDYEERVEPFTSQFVQPLLDAVGGAEQLLDVACGTGAVAITAARRGDQVVATDYSERLVARLRERAGADGVTIESAVADGHADRIQMPRQFPLQRSVTEIARPVQ